MKVKKNIIYDQQQQINDEDTLFKAQMIINIILK